MIFAAIVAASLSVSPCIKVIQYDEGGEVFQYAQEVQRLNKAGCTVAILGRCYSACTLYLGAERVCVGRRARLYFHGPRWRHRKMPKPVFDFVSKFMATHYPKPLAVWFMRTGRGANFTTVHPETLFALGVPECRKSGTAQG